MSNGWKSNMGEAGVNSETDVLEQSGIPSGESVDWEGIQAGVEGAEYGDETFPASNITDYFDRRSNIRDYFNKQDDEGKAWLNKVWKEARQYENKFNDINTLLGWAASYDRDGDGQPDFGPPPWEKPQAKAVDFDQEKRGEPDVAAFTDGYLGPGADVIPGGDNVVTDFGLDDIGIPGFNFRFPTILAMEEFIGNLNITLTPEQQARLDQLKADRLPPEGESADGEEFNPNNLPEDETEYPAFREALLRRLKNGTLKADDIADESLK